MVQTAIFIQTFSCNHSYHIEYDDVVRLFLLFVFKMKFYARANEEQGGGSSQGFSLGNKISCGSKPYVAGSSPAYTINYFSLSSTVHITLALLESSRLLKNLRFSSVQEMCTTCVYERHVYNMYAIRPIVIKLKYKKKYKNKTNKRTNCYND